MLTTMVVLSGLWGVACGSNGGVDFFDSSTGGAGTPPAVNSSRPAGTESVASAGGSAGVGMGGSSSGPSDAPCAPVTDVTGGMTGPFGTKGPVCLRVKGDIDGWGCSNFEGRTLKVNGQSVRCEQIPLPPASHGDYYFDVSAGEMDYASLYWF